LQPPLRPRHRLKLVSFNINLHHLATINHFIQPNRRNLKRFPFGLFLVLLLVLDPHPPRPLLPPPPPPPPNPHPPPPPPPPPPHPGRRPLTHLTPPPPPPPNIPVQGPKARRMRLNRRHSPRVPHALRQHARHHSDIRPDIHRPITWPRQSP